jgi:hypothetical protein
MIREGPRSRFAWRPVLPSEDREQCNELIARAAERMSIVELADPSLASGHAGLALCLAHIPSNLVPAAPEHASRHVERAFALQDQFNGISLFTGVVGLGWLLERIRSIGCAPSDDDLGALDDAISARLEAAALPFDLMAGLSGVAIYAVERCLDGSDRLLPRLEDKLYAQLSWADHRAYLRTGPRLMPASVREQYPDGRVDLAVSHGLCGYIGALCSIEELTGVLRHDSIGPCMATIEHAAAAHGNRSVPPFLHRAGDPSSRRPSWCYGDLGIAAVVARAGNLRGREDWVDLARELALSAAGNTRRPKGTGLCHGAAGLGLTCHRLALMLQSDELEEVARRWYRQAISDLDRSLSDEHPDSDFGLLEGLAGSILALLAAATNDEPRWDGCLLLSAGRREP